MARSVTLLDLVVCKCLSYLLCLADVGEHDQEAPSHPCREQRRGQRHSGWSRLRHAEWRDGQGRLPSGVCAHAAPGVCVCGCACVRVHLRVCAVVCVCVCVGCVCRSLARAVCACCSLFLCSQQDQAHWQRTNTKYPHVREKTATALTTSEPYSTESYLTTLRVRQL